VQAALLEGLTSAIAGEYAYERERVGRSPEQRRAELVRKLLSGAPVEVGAFDYDFGAWHVGVIATGAGAAGALRGLRVGLRCELLSVPRGEQSVWGWFGGGRRLDSADIERLHTVGEGFVGVSLAIGEPARGLEGWRVTHRQAQAARLVALRRSESRGGRGSIPRNWSAPDRIPPARGVAFTRYADVALLAAALKDELLSRVLVEVYLAPLEGSRDGGALLRQTLNAYFDAERNATSAAAALGVVRSTVEGRLRTIETRLGRALHTRLAELEVALRLVELDD
jgi:PucR C-terminal helix-turn-helix domain